MHERKFEKNMEGQEILRLKKIKQKYNNDKTAKFTLENISLTVNKGEIVGVVGESGCGKTTLAKIICGIVEVEAGEIYICGKKYISNKKNAMEEIGSQYKIIFQDPISSFDPQLSIGKSLDIAIKYVNINLNPKERKKEINALLKSMGLDVSIKNKKPHEISGGECQRVAIARAMLSHPKLLICDEITSALDVTTQAQIIQLLLKLSKKEEMAFLFISHDLALMSNFCTHIYIMESGTMIESGTMEQVMNNPQKEYTRFFIKEALDIQQIW